MRDSRLYQSLLGAVMPDVLQRTQPAVTKHIRTLSKRILPWMEEACSALPPQSRAQKIRDTALFAQVTGPSCAKSLFVPCLNPLHAVTFCFFFCLGNGSDFAATLG